MFNDRNSSHRSRFDNHAQVTSGSSTVNGVSIAVNANDIINSVLARITASAAGVTASFAHDKVTLTGKTSSEDAIVLAGDTSGFLNAVKLTGASTVRGNVRDDQQVLSKTCQFGGVTSGSFTVNGAPIAVDAATDTLASVIARINDAQAGVAAAYEKPAAAAGRRYAGLPLTRYPDQRYRAIWIRLSDERAPASVASHVPRFAMLTVADRWAWIGRSGY